MTTTETHYDVIVTGGGAMGLAAAYELSKRKVKVLVLEQFTFMNQLGSSAGVSRQYRIPYPQDYMVKMALEAQPYWDELQNHTGATLMDKVGTLWFGDPTVHSTEGNIAEAEKALQSMKVPYTSLSSKDIESQYHFRDLPGNYTGLFQPDGASINLQATLQTLYDLNKISGYVTLKDEAPVTGIRSFGKSTLVSIPGITYSTSKLVVVPGPYINSIINLMDFTIEATYWNMASAYFKKTNPSIQYPTWFVFQNAVGQNGNQFYGFPEVDWNYPGYIRVAPDFVMHPLADPDKRSFVPNPDELAYTSQWVKNHMTGLDPVPHFTSTCLVALSRIPDKELLIDFAPPFVPNHQNIAIYATGWAAKFIPLLGKILAEMALDGYSSYDIKPFALGHIYFKSLKEETS